MKAMTQKEIKYLKEIKASSDKSKEEKLLLLFGITSKTCVRCNETKLLTEYHQHGDYLLSRCKDCEKTRCQKYCKSKEGKAARKKWNKSGKNSVNFKRWRKKNLKKHREIVLTAHRKKKKTHIEDMLKRGEEELKEWRKIKRRIRDGYYSKKALRVERWRKWLKEIDLSG